MALWSSLVPAVREVRGPLAAGYLWLACGWLLFESAIPSRHSEVLYERIAALADAVGPIGWAVTASIAAYLTGSLIQSGLRLAWRRLTMRLRPLRIDESQSCRFEEIAESDDVRDIETILLIADPFQEASLHRLLRSDRSLSVAIWEIADRELLESFRELQITIERIRGRAGKNAVASFSMHARTPRVSLSGRGGERELVIPHLMPSRDLLAQSSLLETRLLEVAETTGAKVERLHAEADFRIAIFPPLIALILIFAAGASPLWLAGLLVPVALAVQGMALSDRAIEELLDALRARTQTPELEQITPIFERYRAFATKLVEGLHDAHWPPDRVRRKEAMLED